MQPFLLQVKSFYKVKGVDPRESAGKEFGKAQSENVPLMVVAYAVPEF
jgi:hypothetical protein